MMNFDPPDWIQPVWGEKTLEQAILRVLGYCHHVVKKLTRRRPVERAATMASTIPLKIGEDILLS
jgi:hypothetical protein